MSYPKKEEIIKLIRKVNQSKKRVKKGLYPLEYIDDEWRIVLPKSLEFYDFCQAGRKLLEMAEYDLDMKGGYYWIQYSELPKGVTTPSIRLKYL